MVRTLPAIVLVLTCAAPAIRSDTETPVLHSSGRPLPAMPDIKAPVLFNTPEADRILAALQVFPASNAWNEDISQLAILPSSKQVRSLFSVRMAN